MPLRGDGTPAGSVPVDALDAEEIAGLLAEAAAVTAALDGDPAAEAACADAAPDRDGIGDLHMALGWCASVSATITIGAAYACDGNAGGLSGRT